MPLAVHALDHIVLNVTDVEASARWYVTILGVLREDFDPGQGKPRRTSIKFDNRKINLRPVTADKIEWYTAQHERAGSDDVRFLTGASPDEIVAHLRAHDVAVEEGPVVKHGALGRLHSVYCRDPDGNLVEIASYAAKPSAGSLTLEREARHKERPE